MNPSARKRPNERPNDPAPEVIDHSPTNKRRRIEIDLTGGELSSTSKKARVKIDPGSPLCAICQNVDLEAIFQVCFDTYQRVRDGLESLDNKLYHGREGRYFYDDAIAVHQFKDRLSKPSMCPLCEFFRSLRIEPDKYPHHKLLAFRSSDSWLFQAEWLRKNDVYKDFRDTVFMAVVPDVESIPVRGYEADWLDHGVPLTGAIYLSDPSDNPPLHDDGLLDARELGEKADLTGMRSYIDSCKKSHGNACRQCASHQPINRGFRLINCEKDPPIVQDMPWGTPYAALSYVWGSSPEDLKDWPETVLDAIEVTKKMGLQYIWVDRLCINQSDAAEKSYLISRMTTIYEEADFTVVAAAGSGAGHGLPGVGQRPRKPQPKYYLDSGKMLLSILRDPRRDILESQYWTRGWTYQEGVLSNRRIVFTEQQVYWECRCMAGHESAGVAQFYMPQTNDENPDWIMADFMLTGIFKGAVYSGGVQSEHDQLVIMSDDAYRLDYGFSPHQKITVRGQLRGLNEHIRAFSKRKLTHDMDSLLAFQGLVGMYQQTKELYLFQGIPMWMGQVAGSSFGARITFALSVSSWYHRSGPDYLMYSTEDCRRKQGFPSWTWAGWAGTVTWRAPPNLEHCAYMSDLIKVKSHTLLWTADIYLGTPTTENKMRPVNMYSTARLNSEAPSLIEIRNPMLLYTFERVEESNKEWTWGVRHGRSGREQLTEQSQEWDAKWYRIGRRLASIGMSIAMTEREWTEKHVSGELLSVLVFAGKYLENEHGTARFLTVRKVSDSPERWERIGTLYLIIPFLGNCPDMQRFFRGVPAAKGRRSNIVIQ